MAEVLLLHALLQGMLSHLSASSRLVCPLRFFLLLGSASRPLRCHVVCLMHAGTLALNRSFYSVEPFVLPLVLQCRTVSNRSFYSVERNIQQCQTKRSTHENPCFYAKEDALISPAGLPDEF